ncbi:MAG: hypothetical protein ACJA08_000840 [Cyclobacteriaceae bacterium]|jgi:hypothetical protein
MKRICGVVLFLVMLFQLSAQDKTRPTQPDLPGDFLIDYGFSFWNKKLSQLPVKPIGSNSVGFYYNRRLEINDHISFHPAVGFGFEKYAFSGDYTWQNQAGVMTLDTIGSVTFSKNKLTATYFEIPLELRIHPLGTVNGEGWFIGIGAIVGLKMGSHTKIKYDQAGETYKEKVYDTFDMQGYRYGLQFRFGFRSVHFYYKTYLSDVFKSGPEASGRVPRGSTIGINISGF